MCHPCCPPCASCSPSFETKNCQSYELQCGIMYNTCDCVKRNGLQDKCQRIQCQGRSACMCFPRPQCCPSTFPLRFGAMTMGVKKSRCSNNTCTSYNNSCSNTMKTQVSNCLPPPTMCPSRYLKQEYPCKWKCSCKAHCYD